MKKIVVLLSLIICSLHAQEPSFTGALTAGLVFKNNDCTFKEIYGRALTNVITVDGCLHPLHSLGIGAKVSYWRAHGCTTFLQRRTLLQEVPITFYLRSMQDFNCGLRLYASLGGGLIWINEKSYLGCVRMTKGIGEVETGLDFPIACCWNITGAFRYIFPTNQTHCCKQFNAGGMDVRVGISLSL